MQDKADRRTDTVVQICCCRQIDRWRGREPHFSTASTTATTSASLYYGLTDALFPAGMVRCFQAHVSPDVKCNVQRAALQSAP